MPPSADGRQQLHRVDGRHLDPPDRVPASGSRRFLLALATGAAVLFACVGPDTPRPETTADIDGARAAFVEFLGSLDAGDYRAAIGRMRADNGDRLDALSEERITTAWIRVLGPAGERVTFRVSVDAVNPIVIPPGVRADAVVDLTASVEGGSDGCPPLPLHNLGARVAKIRGRWYVLEDPVGGYDFACRR